MLDFETTVKTRQSIRKFLPTPMTEAEIRQVLEDAQNAPSACGHPDWEAMQNKEHLGRVSIDECATLHW